MIHRPGSARQEACREHGLLIQNLRNGSGQERLGRRSERRGLFRHHYEQDSAFVPTADPANAPAIDSIAQRDGLEEPQELGLNFHSDPSITLLGWTVKDECRQPHWWLLLDFVLRFRFFHGLPLDVGRIIGAAAFERDNVINHVPRVGAGTGRGRRTRVARLEGTASTGAPANAAVYIPFAIFAVAGTVTDS